MLALDYKKCENIIKQNSTSFYKAFSQIKDKKKRNAIYAVYAFCRLADDLIDEKKNIDGLVELENQLTNFLNNDSSHSYLWNALKDVFNNYEMNSKAFYDMIEGQKIDYNHKYYQTLDELLSYCYYVASSVGLMIIPILAPKNHIKLENCALKLGYAMQITNILRDIGDDFQKGRVYLPKQLMDKYNYSYQDLGNHLINESFINLWEELANYAESLYDEVIQDFNLFPNDSIEAVYLSTLFYKGILNACRKANYNVFSQRNYVTNQDKLSIMGQFKQKMKEYVYE